MANENQTRPWCWHVNSWAPSWPSVSTSQEETCVVCFVWGAGPFTSTHRLQVLNQRGGEKRKEKKEKRQKQRHILREQKKGSTFPKCAIKEPSVVTRENKSVSRKDKHWKKWQSGYRCAAPNHQEISGGRAMIKLFSPSAFCCDVLAPTYCLCAARLRRHRSAARTQPAPERWCCRDEWAPGVRTLHQGLIGVCKLKKKVQPGGEAAVCLSFCLLSVCLLVRTTMHSARSASSIHTPRLLSPQIGYLPLIQDGTAESSSSTSSSSSASASTAASWLMEERSLLRKDATDSRRRWNGTIRLTHSHMGTI